MDSAKVILMFSCTTISDLANINLNINLNFIHFITFQLISLSFFEGMIDSVKNIVVVFYLDREMNKKLSAKNEKLANTETTKKPNKEKKKE